MNPKIYTINTLSFLKEKAFNIKIEGVIISSGSGKVTVTGNLGIVAKETILLVKSLLGLNHPHFYSNNYHIHFEYHALYKEGPSCGLSCYILFAWLIGVFNYKKGIAATGEIDLRGNIKPVQYMDAKRSAWASSECSLLIMPHHVEIPEQKNIAQISNVSELNLVLKNDNYHA